MALLEILFYKIKIFISNLYYNYFSRLDMFLSNQTDAYVFIFNLVSFFFFSLILVFLVNEFYNGFLISKVNKQVKNTYKEEILKDIKKNNLKEYGKKFIFLFFLFIFFYFLAVPNIFAQDVYTYLTITTHSYFVLILLIGIHIILFTVYFLIGYISFFLFQNKVLKGYLKKENTELIKEIDFLISKNDFVEKISGIFALDKEKYNELKKQIEENNKILTLYKKLLMK